MGSLEVMISEERLRARVQEMAEQIRADIGAAPLTCIGVLKGSFVFMADLVRVLGGDMRCEFLGVSSYGGGTRSSGEVKITHDLRRSLEGQDVLIIEDIVDSGRTLSFLRRMLALREPRSLRCVSLLDKPSRREVEAVAEYVGFSIPDRFVVGYGLDFDGRFRNLPHIAVYDPEGEQ